MQNILTEFFAIRRHTNKQAFKFLCLHVLSTFSSLAENKTQKLYLQTVQEKLNGKYRKKISFKSPRCSLSYSFLVSFLGLLYWYKLIYLMNSNARFKVCMQPIKRFVYPWEKIRQLPSRFVHYLYFDFKVCMQLFKHSFILEDISLALKLCTISVESKFF